MVEPFERNREDVMHAWSLARTLHTRVPEEGHLASNAAFRERVRRTPALSALPLSVKRTLYLVADVLSGHSPTALLQVASSPAFVEDLDFARCVLALLSKDAQPDRAVLLLAKALSQKGVPSLSPSRRRQAAKVIVEGASHPPTYVAFEVLIADRGFLASSDPQKRALLDYLLGPILSFDAAPMRRNRVRLLWAGRVAALMRVLQSSAYRGATDVVATEHLRDFMCAPTQKVTFIDATPRNGHAVVIFGEAYDRKTLSYGRRWILGPARRPVPCLYSPDPSVLSGWTKPTIDASIPYHGRVVRISRRRELALVNWIEAGHLFTEDLRAGGGLGARRVTVQEANFVDRAFTALEGMAGDRQLPVTTGIFVSGRSLAEGRAQAQRSNRDQDQDKARSHC